MEGVLIMKVFAPLIGLMLVDYKMHSEWLGLSFPHIALLTWEDAARIFS